MTEYELLLKRILDLGAEMIRSGAETHRVEDSLYRVCESNAFSDCNIWVIPSNIQATVVTPSGECLSQIRHIRRSGVDFLKLDALNALCRRVCAERPSAAALARANIHGSPKLPRPIIASLQCV